MTHEPYPPARSRERRETGGTAERKTLVAQLTAFLAIATAVLTSLHQSCQANRRVDVVGERAAVAAEKGERSEEKAEVAKISAEAAYDATKGKVDPQGEAIEQLRADLNVLLAERAARLEKVKAKGGSKPEAVPPKDVPPAVGKELPPSPAAAAAAAGIPVPPKETP